MHAQKCRPLYGYFLRKRRTNTIDAATIVEIKATIALVFQSIDNVSLAVMAKKSTKKRLHVQSFCFTYSVTCCSDLVFFSFFRHRSGCAELLLHSNFQGVIITALVGLI